MRALACAGLLALALLAGCSDTPDAGAAAEGAEPVADERATEGARLGRSAEASYECTATWAAAVGAGSGFATGFLASICPEVKLRAEEGAPFRSGRLTMAWSQASPAMTDAYVEFTDGEQVYASGSSATSPVVVEFQVDGLQSVTGWVYSGGTGAAVTFEGHITLEMFPSETPPPLPAAA